MACRAEGRWIRTRPWPLEPWCLRLALHEDVKLAKARVWARGDWDRKGFLGKRKSPFALWLKVLLASGLCTVVTPRSSASRCFQEGQQEGL